MTFCLERSSLVRVVVTLLVHLVVVSWLCAQPRGADAVVVLTPGVGAGYGFEYLPDNVLGLPDSTARPSIPTVDPKQIAGIGLGGEITLSFDRAIVDGPGPDFTVFENAFFYMLGSVERVYAEPAEVSVSSDGIVFVSFPFDSLTLDGCAGTRPTEGDRNPGDPLVSGGNSFDLAVMQVDSIRYVRLRDVTSIILGNSTHPFRDPTLSGFDLDAVVAIHSAPALPGVVTIDRSRGSSVVVVNDRITIDGVGAGLIELRLYSIDGREQWRDSFESGLHTIPLSSIVAGHGCYILTTTAGGQTTATRLSR